MANPNPDRRAALLSELVAYVLDHGLSNLSLRALALGLRTSQPMLIYHFESKGQLIVDLLAEIRRRKYAEAQRAPRKDALSTYWNWAISAEGRRYLSLTYELYGLALHDPEGFVGFLAAEVRDVLAFIDEGYRRYTIPESDARLLTTYTYLVLRGLELQLLSTDDTARVDAAFHVLEADLNRRAEALASKEPPP